MDWTERKRIKEDKKDRISKLSDKDKLDLIVSILKERDSIDMLTEGSDTYGINFTEEYDKWEEDIEDFLDAIG